ncbi:MAG: uracil-DNA glycosylase family protein [Patescibacteria group bacterium]
MQIKKLFKAFDDLQKIYGDPRLNAIYGAGKIKRPNLFLVFMNPTVKNNSSNKLWQGIRAPWIGNKSVWKMLYQLGLFDKKSFEEINNKKPTDWDCEFSKKIYKIISSNSLYITNLSKATQIDARPLKDFVFKKYLPIFEKEIAIINPKIIICFGNQVSSILLNKKIKVSDYRKKHEILQINKQAFQIFPVYYPIGQGTRNMDKAKEDIAWILKNVLKS